jgi:anti-sigma regulatory factor (Ser/Thr protein kinase)
MGAIVTERAFAPDPASVRVAREVTSSALRGLDPATLGDVLVAVSELTTNCVRHARSPFTLRISWDSGEVRLEVDDESTDQPIRRQPDLDAPGGRGILLIEALADAWGVDALAGGKRVWAIFKAG